MARIEAIHAREILDSRGNPTVEAEVLSSRGHRGVARVPSGASTGKREAVELRDGETARYRGKGVRRAVENVERHIAARLVGMEVGEQEALDRAMIELDGTPGKSRLGANAILAVSLATAHAAAADAGVELYQHLADGQDVLMPVPMMNLINGGAHADNNLDLQEFMVVPTGADSLREAVRYGTEIYHALGSLLRRRGLVTAVGDEGGYAPALPGNESALELLLQAVADTGLQAPGEVYLGLDVAASEFYRDGHYHLSSGNETLEAAELVERLATWSERYPILTIEDGMAEDDTEGWQLLSRRLGERVQLVGDDLFVTHPDQLSAGIEAGIANAILIKPNQVGTLSETLHTLRIAADAGYARILSHRSGETEDTTIADLAVGSGAGQIKTGAPCRSDRVAKYNRLACIEDRLGPAARYPGDAAFPCLARATAS